MPRISPFEAYADQYESWFEKNRWVYEAELRAVKAMMPEGGSGLEIGVGSGRFASPLGIRDGVEPSKHMRAFAQRRGIRAVDGVAEDLPYGDSQFDFVLMVRNLSATPPSQQSRVPRHGCHNFHARWRHSCGGFSSLRFLYP